MFTFVLDSNKWKEFGSQELLIERLWGCSLGIKLTPILHRGLFATIQSPNAAEHVALEDDSTQVYSNGSVLSKLPAFSHSSRGQLPKSPVHTAARHCVQVTQVQKYWFLQPLSRVFRTAWRRTGTGGDPAG